MCGVAGIVRFDDQPIDPARLRAMLAALRHRGPDGEGIAELGRCGLVHSRLAILDIPGGAQPMSAPHCPACAGLTVVFNGEIYNHRQLRRRLEARGHRFQTDHCDTEVLLHGYSEWGVDLLPMLEGMFAFALWDKVGDRLLLARDRVGKKPLFRWQRGAELVFGSLVSACLTAAPSAAAPGVDRAALRQFLRFGYTDTRTLLTGIEELPAGHYELIDRTGRAEAHAYSRPLEEFGAVASAPGDAAAPEDMLTTHLRAAVETRLEADVPMGCFLSGGIDSAVVAALAHAALRERREPPLRTFTVRMADADHDESPLARLVARHLGTQHHELSADSGHDAIGDLATLTRLAGEPLGDSSVLPTYWLSRSVREHVPVVLSGDGGDELFGGYDRYRALALLRRHGWWLRCVPTVLLASAEQRSRRGRLRRLAEAGRYGGAAEQYRSMVRLFTETQLQALMGDEGTPADVFAAAPLPAWPVQDDPRRSAMLWDFAHYLPFDLLRKVDRAAMAVALEVRCPLLDHDVCLAAARLPTGTLLPGGRPKGLLREIARRLGLPEPVLDAPKRGFAIPIGRWFTGPLRQPLADHLFDGGLESLGLRRAAVERLYQEHTQGRRDHTHRLFALLALSLWVDWLRGVTRR